MHEINPWWSVLFPASAAFFGAALGALVRPLIDHMIQKWQRKATWKREAMQEQLDKLYRPLYVNFVIMPKEDPENYFSEWKPDDFRVWLGDALDILIANVHLVPNVILEQIHTWREMVVRGEDRTEAEVRFLYDHIGQHFQHLRKELEISTE